MAGAQAEEALAGGNRRAIGHKDGAAVVADDCAIERAPCARADFYGNIRPSGEVGRTFDGVGQVGGGEVALEAGREVSGGGPDLRKCGGRSREGVTVEGVFEEVRNAVAFGIGGIVAGGGGLPGTEFLLTPELDGGQCGGAGGVGA